MKASFRFLVSARKLFFARSKAGVRGQGTIEYILILLVVVMITIGGIYQFDDAFKEWANNYFGNYLACLLETGELPALGGQDNVGGECNADFKPFNIADGRPLAGKGISDSGSQDNQGESSSQSEPAGAGKASVGSHGGGGGGTRGSSASGGPLIPLRSSYRGGSSIVDAGPDEKLYTGSSAISLPAGVGDDKPREIRIPYRIPASMDFGVIGDQKKAGAKRIPVKAPKKTGEVNRSPQLLKVHASRPQDNTAKASKPWTFGYLLRIILIAGIIIAIVFVLGGQLLQISKSME